MLFPDTSYTAAILAGAGDLFQANTPTKVSKALEQHYKVRKTYLLSIADKVYHTHFHLIPKHPNLVGMGKYSFAVLSAVEGFKNTPKDEQNRMAKLVGSLIE